MTAYEALLIVPALLIVIALGLFITSFFQYKPSEVFGVMGKWLLANAWALGFYIVILILLGVFLF